MIIRPPNIQNLINDIEYNKTVIQIEQYVEENKRIIKSPDLGEGEYSREENICFDKIHYTSKGYRLIASKIFPFLMNPMIKVEYQQFQ